jgi:hypothetical protein
VRLGAFLKGETRGQLIIILASEVKTAPFAVSENKQDELQTLRPAYACNRQYTKFRQLVCDLEIINGGFATCNGPRKISLLEVLLWRYFKF